MTTRKVKRIGSKAEVWHSSADHTSSGLKKKDLMKNKHGRIISRKQHAAGKKAIKHLFSMGYKPKKGTFSLFHKGTAKRTGKGKRTTRRRRGGANMGMTGDTTVPGMPMYGINKAQGISGTQMPVGNQAGKV